MFVIKINGESLQWYHISILIKDNYTMIKSLLYNINNFHNLIAFELMLNIPMHP